MSVTVFHTDDECEDPRCPQHGKQEWVPKAPNGVGKQPCPGCGYRPLELVDGICCERCYQKTVLLPLANERNELLKKLSLIDQKLAEGVAKVTHTEALNINVTHTCECGKQYKSALELINHIPDCPGAVAKPVVKHQTSSGVRVSNHFNPRSFKIGA